MTKKDVFLITLVVVLGGLYAIYFSEWFRPKYIRIEYSSRPLREAWSGQGQRVDPQGNQVGNVTFSFHGDYRLTSVKVVSTAEFATNKYAHPLWHMVCKNGSQPVSGFSYGLSIPGMSAAAADSAADPLEPGVQYSLLVEAGSLKGTNNFSIGGPMILER